MPLLGRICIVLQASLLVLVCTACAPTRSVRQVNEKINVVDDKFNPYKVILGSSVHAYEGGADTERFWQLRSFVDRQDRVLYHDIYLVLTYDNYPGAPYTAVDDNARPLKVDTLVQEHCPYNRCDRTDSIAVRISETMLRDRTDTGFEIRVSGRNNWRGVFSITPKMIAGQLDALAKIVPQSAIAATPPTSAPDPMAPGRVPVLAEPTPKRPSAAPSIGLQMIPQATSELTHGNMRGAVVLAVIADSPAGNAGIRGGDLIVKIDGHPVDSGPEVQDVIAKIKPNSVVKVDILRGPTNVTVNLKL
jgi:hypothetical protein